MGQALDADLIARLKKINSAIVEYVEGNKLDDTVEADNEFDSIANLNLAKALRHLRSRRARSLPASILGEPGWDIMLELYIATTNGRRASVSDLCLGSDQPATTALRYIHRIVDDGLAIRAGDPSDGRRVFVELTSLGKERMNQALARWLDFPPRSKT